MGISTETYETLRAAFLAAFDDALDANSESRDKIWALRDAADSLASAITVDVPAPEPEPIKDTRVYVDSRSRFGVSHTVTVHDGKLRCTCEDATYRPENGPCFHASLAIREGSVDDRAVWDGGLHGKPESSFGTFLLTT